MKTKTILAGILACTGFTANAQSEQSSEEINGKAIIQVFTNFHNGFFSHNDDRGFELERSYLGYECKIGKELSIKGVADFGKSSAVDDYQRIAYIKNAMVKWHRNKLTLSGGLISTTQFGFQEKFWGYRYVRKSFQDEYKFGSSADLGLSLAYDFSEYFSADAIVVNGEGYKKMQNKDGLNYGIGATIKPVKGLQARVYGGVNQKSEEDQKSISNFAAFLGYKCDAFSIGTEYNHIWNSSYKEDADLSGMSFYVDAKVGKKTNIYARYDELFSKDDWNKAKDESAAILGCQIKLNKYVKIAPNIRLNMPKEEDADNVCYAYVNCFFGF